MIGFLSPAHVRARARLNTRKNKKYPHLSHLPHLNRCNHLIVKQ